MGVKRLKIKDDLNYRRGYTWAACEYCDQFVRGFGIASNKGTATAEPRCKIIGLNPGRLYRINPKYICDKYECLNLFEKELQAKAEGRRVFNHA